MMFRSVRSALISLIFTAPLSLPAAAEFKAPDGPDGTWVRQIGLGRFEIARGATRGEAEVISYQTRKLRLLGLIYHDVYDGICDITGPSQSFTLQVDSVTKNYAGVELDRRKGSPETLTVRSEYVDVVDSGYQLMANPVTLLTTMGANFNEGLLELATSSRDVIVTNGCNSEGLEIFEKNLAAIVRGQPSLQRRGLTPSLLEQRCTATDLAGLSARSAVPTPEACQCLAEAMWGSLPEVRVAEIEDGFSRESLLLGAALTPESWKEARACVR